VFCSKVNTLGRPLVLRDVGLVHDELALPDTSKGQVPEIAVRQKNEMMKKAKEQIMDRQKQPTRPASIVSQIQFNTSIKRTWRFKLSARKQAQIILWYRINRAQASNVLAERFQNLERWVTTHCRYVLPLPKMLLLKKLQKTIRNNPGRWMQSIWIGEEEAVEQGQHCNATNLQTFSAAAKSNRPEPKWEISLASNRPCCNRPPA
jgi:hypothetical protein